MDRGPLACSETELTSEIMNLFRHFGRTTWMKDRPIAEKRGRISMSRVGFELTILMFKRSKTILVLDHAAPWTSWNLDFSF